LVENAQHYLDNPKDINDRDSFHWHAEMVKVQRRFQLESSRRKRPPPLWTSMNRPRRLAESWFSTNHTEQVFVRHAFRFWMGRNETVNDAPVLQEAYRAYKDSGGSMKALLVSLLTSDAFLYRTRSEPALAETN
jgi:hypothetical protein